MGCKSQALSFMFVFRDTKVYMLMLPFWRYTVAAVVQCLQLISASDCCLEFRCHTRLHVMFISPVLPRLQTCFLEHCQRFASSTIMFFKHSTSIYIFASVTIQMGNNILVSLAHVLNVLNFLKQKKLSTSVFLKLVKMWLGS